MVLASSPGPLTETVFYILIALSRRMHGYGIMQHVSEISGGRVTIGAGTLYGALASLVAKGWIEPVVGSTDERKKEYVITETGREIVRAEMTRLEELLRNARTVTGGDSR